MEFADYVAVIRRRWPHLIIVVLLLGGGLSFFAVVRERPAFVAESHIGILEEYRMFDPAQVAQFIPAESTGYGYYTREALVTSPQVYRLAAAIYQAVRDGHLRFADEAAWRVPEELTASHPLVRNGYLGEPVTLPFKWNEAKIQAAEARIRSAVTSAKKGERIQLIGLQASSSDRQDAVLMANCVARAAQVYSRAQATSILDLAGGEVEQKILVAEGRVRAKQAEDGSPEEAVRDLERRISVVTAAAYDLERQIEEAKTRRAKTLARIRGLEVLEHRLREPLPPAPEEGLSSPVLDRVRQDLTGTRTEVAIKKLAWTPDNPDFKKLVAKMEQLQEEERAELNRVRGQTILALREQMSEIAIELGDLEGRRSGQLEVLREMHQRLREEEPRRAEMAQVRKELEGYQDVRRRLQAARAVQQGFYVFEEVARDARPQERRAWRLVPLYLLAGLVSAFALAFLLEYLDTSLRTDIDVKRHLNLTCLAMVRDTKGDDPLILRAAPGDPLGELMNVAATVLRSYLTEREFKSFVVCSAVPQEGKSTMAANLGVALARKGLRVVIVDTDIRIPQMHQIFALDNTRGLSTFLRLEEGATLEALVGYTEIPTLRVLPSGPPVESPTELVESPRLADLLRALRESYDVVICDSPPVSIAADALALARVVDTTVLVIGSGLSDRRLVTWTRQLLLNVRADIAGSILNFARHPVRSSSYYYDAPEGRASRSPRARA